MKKITLMFILILSGYFVKSQSHFDGVYIGVDKTSDNYTVVAWIISGQTVHYCNSAGGSGISRVTQRNGGLVDANGVFLSN